MPTQCLLTLVKCQDGNRFHWFRFQNWRKLLTVWDANENGSQFKVYDLESVFHMLNLLFLLHAGIRRQHGPIHGCQPSSEESHWNTIHPNYSSLLARRHCFKSWLLWMPVRQVSCMHDFFYHDIHRNCWPWTKPSHFDYVLTFLTSFSTCHMSSENL